LGKLIFDVVAAAVVAAVVVQINQ